MKNYTDIITLILKFEGLYSNDKDDPGQETFRGISRKYHPDWNGWKTIDKYKDLDGNFIDKIESDSHLQILVNNFYFEKYYSKLNLNMFDNYENIQCQLLDIGINQGVSIAGICLQETLNLLNRNNPNIPELNIDGVIGNKTIEVMNAIIKNDKTSFFISELLLVNRIKKYEDSISKNKTLKKYIRGWMNRAFAMYNYKKEV